MRPFTNLLTKLSRTKIYSFFSILAIYFTVFLIWIKFIGKLNELNNKIVEAAKEAKDIAVDEFTKAHVESVMNDISAKLE